MSEDALRPPQETTAGTATAARDASGSTLKQIALSFLRLGTTAFGGPAAHIAMMEEEFVRRRGWVSHADFPRHARSLQSGSRSEFDGNGHSYRASTSRLERAGRSRRVLHPSGNVDRDGLCVGLLDLRFVSSGAKRPLRGQTGHHRRRAAGSMGPRTHRDKGRLSVSGRSVGHGGRDRRWKCVGDTFGRWFGDCTPKRGSRSVVSPAIFSRSPCPPNL